MTTRFFFHPKQKRKKREEKDKQNRTNIEGEKKTSDLPIQLDNSTVGIAILQN